MDSFPIRFLTPFSIRSSQRLRNSLRSDILAARLRRVPSKDTWEGSIFYGHIIHPQNLDLNREIHYHRIRSAYKKREEE
jgi:hypothetical protein